ncbi:hypothetical protein EVAR_79940_1 [Eumeta japonica]|uniref:Pre-C2HC domain-containing protein n=1 Tax=Eumeta variegata TaxID=151549 RepID=A0A4C1Y594_EUMVA|nr:hypothetical protein EVAR_79940_1 [Eumeta japonica]
MLFISSDSTHKRAKFDRPPRTDAPGQRSNKLFAFVQIAAPMRPRDLPALLIESVALPAATLHNPTIIYYFRRARAQAFPLQGTANPDGLGTTGLGGCSSPIPGVARPPSIILTPSSVPVCSLPWTKIPLLPGAGGPGPKTPITLEFIQQVPTKALSEIDTKRLRTYSSSDEGATCSDSTVVGSDSESENNNTSLTLVEGKNKRALKKALKKVKVARDQPEMDIDPPSASTSRANDAKPSTAAVQQTQTTSTAPVESTRNPVSASTRSNCTRLRINYSKAVRTADDGIKIHCPDVETFRSLNKYFVDFKVQFHTYALEEERKLKAVIRGIPTDFPVDEIQADLCGQGFPVHSVHRLCRRDGSPLWLVLSVLPRTEEAKNILNNLNMVCGLSSIRVEDPHKKGGPGKWTRPRGRQLSCGPALREMFGPTLDQGVPAYSPNPNRPKIRPVAPPRDLNNFPDFAGNKRTPPAAASRSTSNPWGKPKKPTLPPRSVPGPSGEAVRREPPVSLPASATAGTSSFGDDIQAVMSILRAVKSSEISEFARDFQACSNVEEKLMVLDRYHHLMVKLESI